MNLETLPLQQQQGQQPVAQTQPQNPAQAQNGASGGQLDATVGQNGQAPLQVGGRFGTQQFGKVGNDVYEIMSDGSRRAVTAAEFTQKLQAQGLNLDVLPQLDQNQGFQDGLPSGTAGSGPDGIMGTADDTGEPKTPSGFVDDYQAVLKELGVSSIKEEFDSIQKQYKDLQDEKLDAQLEIQDNPWISESIRVARLRKLDEKYAGKEANLTNQLNLYSSLYERAIADAKYLTSGLQEDRNKLLDLAMKQENAERAIAQQEFENQLDIANLSMKEREFELAQYKASVGGGTSSRAVSGGTVTDFGTVTEPSLDTRITDINGKPIKLTGAQIETISGFENTLQQINEAKPLLSKVNTGPISGRLSDVLRLINKDDPNRIALDAKLNSIKANFLKAISGAAVSESEVGRLTKFLPSINDTEETLAIKIQELERAITTQKSNYLKTIGASTQSVPTSSGQTTSGIKYQILP